MRSIGADEAADYVGFLAPFVPLDMPASAERTRALLGWAPSEAGLLDDLAAGFYFDAEH